MFAIAAPMVGSGRQALGGWRRKNTDEARRRRSHGVRRSDRMAQRLLDKTKWLASNAGNLRHEPLAADFPSISQYAVGGWRIFYALDQSSHVVDVHLIAHCKALRQVKRQGS